MSYTNTTCFFLDTTENDTLLNKVDNAETNCLYSSQARFNAKSKLYNFLFPLLLYHHSFLC